MQRLTLIHRWIGLVLCLFFATWFLSGAVLIYHPFPSLSQAERHANNPSIDFTKIKISPTAVIEATGNIELDRFRLIDVADRPAYILHPPKTPIVIIGADDGKRLDLLSGKAAGRIAELFSRKSALRVEGPLSYDQWIVPNHYDPYRPFYRISMQDKKETVFYVSALTGEILQKTEGHERLWNYIGAIPHWIYLTFLRSDWALWDQVVWWLSLFGVITALTGMYLGIARFREAKNNIGLGHASPFQGWLRAHHLFGLFAGIFILTWIFSGWLSMDHGRLFSKPNPDSRQKQNFRGTSINQSMEKFSLSALKSLKNSNEVEVLAIGGQVFLMSRSPAGMKLFKPMTPDSLSPTKILESDVIDGVKKAWPDKKIQSTQRPEESDIYGNLREGSLPSNTLRVILNNPEQTWVNINMESGQIVSIMNKNRRLYRWLFNGLHSLDIPGLANHRPLWDVVILLMLTAGFLFSITAVMIAWKRIFKV